jgi:putative radical SAM enzyme (TIGR03279 family)
MGATMQSNKIDAGATPGGEITSVQPGSMGHSLGLLPGDFLTSINGVSLESILDYRYQVTNEWIEFEILRQNQKIQFEIEKDYDQDLGLEFQDVLFDRIRRCKNNCDFCFIYQLPKKMRRSLYIKDDDYRLSFLYGNYVTLAGLKEQDYQKIIEYRLSPLYVSVHATDIDIRRQTLKNPKADNILERLRFLIDNGIEIFTQNVVCPGLNDGEILERSIEDLSALYPGVKALGVVPVGLTQYQARLKRMQPHTVEEARECIAKVAPFQKRFQEELGTAFVQMGDEFYLKAKVEFPSAQAYDDYDLLENGIGTSRKFIDEFSRHYDDRAKLKQSVGIITGKDGEEVFRSYILPKLSQSHRKMITVLGVENQHFGDGVTVSGLIVGKDILAQVPPADYDLYLLPRNCLKFDEPKFLDDLSLLSLQDGLKSPVNVVEDDAKSLVQAIF